MKSGLCSCALSGEECREICCETVLGTFELHVVRKEEQQNVTSPFHGIFITATSISTVT